MALLKFKDFDRNRREVKEQKLRERQANQFKKAFLENLERYGVKDASELDEDQLAEFMETMKKYKIKNNNETFT